ncbi:hypothetical protein [Pyrobaculum ferrireducens]|uniref:Uncharacterized protein n=1 Tax=Pyrobaculum ferrireducens TaxID=1104324 RepID=G7VAS0_9CREN|nr:hypothetical protein [Pyrobaculum ferrireducens]AET33498.1 hypothetical protein P186_2106 [Pyrobaculum ferrireducens]
MRAIALLVAVAFVALFITAYSYSLGQAKGGDYLVIARFPPHALDKIDKALEEVRREAKWASWYGDVDIPLGQMREVREKLIENHGIDVETKNKVRYRIHKKAGKYRVEVYHNDRLNFTYTTDDLEDALWAAAEKGEELGGIPPEIISSLIDYKLNPPLLYSAYAIPFCNGTYYGPGVDALKIVIDGAVRVEYSVKNRTITPIQLPKAVVVTNVTRLGERWYGKYVVDACALPRVEKRGVIAIVGKGSLPNVIEILKKYTGEEPYVRPIP